VLPGVNQRFTQIGAIPHHVKDRSDLHEIRPCTGNNCHIQLFQEIGSGVGSR
jgi:hypothetical protein